MSTESSRINIFFSMRLFFECWRLMVQHNSSERKALQMQWASRSCNKGVRCKQINQGSFSWRMIVNIDICSAREAWQVDRSPCYTFLHAGWYLSMVPSYLVHLEIYISMKTATFHHRNIYILYLTSSAGNLRDRFVFGIGAVSLSVFMAVCNPLLGWCHPLRSTIDYIVTDLSFPEVRKAVFLGVRRR